MNELALNEKTMSSKQIAEVVDKRHDNVKRTIETLVKQGVISKPQFEDGGKAANGVVEKLYMINERDSYVVVAQLCPEFTAKLVDYWQATKNQKPVIALPKTYKEALLALVAAEDEKEKLLIERDVAIATKAQINDTKTATAMNTASQAVKKLKKVEAELGRCIENATIIAVKKLTGTEYAWQPLRKWCKTQGVKPLEVVDARYGLVKSWPSAAWVAVHGVDLAKLF
jgi:phage regulator Rha-like protein